MTSQHRDREYSIVSSLNIIYIHWIEGVGVLQRRHSKLHTVQSHTTDEENRSVQFVSVTQKNMLTFEAVIFIRQGFVTLEGNSVMELHQGFFF